MRKGTKYGWLIAAAVLALSIVSCTADAGSDGAQPPKGTRAYADVTLAGSVNAETRASLNAYDHWSVSTFGPGDEAGMITVYGRQNPENRADFSLPVQNERMVYEGRMGTYYRFGTTEIVIDPQTVNSDASFMYYPYYADMPDPDDKTGLPGMPLRQMDGGIEKCVDFMCTIKWTSGTVNVLYRIQLTNGVLTPEFKHYFTSLVLQRGEGFENAPDKRIWVVMKNPYTDVRFNVYHSSGSNSYYYHKYILQYNPEVFGPTGDDLMVDLHRLPYEDSADDPKETEPFNVNKYALWQTWEGNAYNGLESRYVVIPPLEDVYFIYIQDNYGNWQKVSDFKLDTGKAGAHGTRYTLTIMLVGTKVVVRPVSIVPWDEELNIADMRDFGINDTSEYFNWVSAYNAYIAGDHSESAVEKLKEFGEATENTATGELSWTFYINDNLDFGGVNSNDFAQITRLDDAIEGASTYTNYSIANIRDTMVKKMGEGGAIRALDFENIYLVQQTSDEPFGALVGVMEGGTIERCNMLNGVLVSENEVGMIAGKATGGKVSECVVSGNVIGKSTADGYGGLFGVVEPENCVSVSDSRTRGLQFVQN